MPFELRTNVQPLSGSSNASKRAFIISEFSFSISEKSVTTEQRIPPTCVDQHVEKKSKEIVIVTALTVKWARDQDSQAIHPEKEIT
ncbi:hypothetical protein E6H34_04780 [Candidatus Bathyarchaeota archaeon]|nr:MAG: hypothetical protein E6H34_04780 [Candidatus Bathyarchaeota archaeon]